MSFPERLADAAAAVEAFLNLALGELPVTQEAQLEAAMRHAVQGGKGVRGFLVLESASLHGVDRKTALPAAAAIEALHAYSLVHDDLPAMDDDAMRRGRPTVHVVYDEATAILVGDALQSLAFELLSDDRLGAARVPLVASLARAAGARGMVLGQALDIAAERAQAPLDLERITRLQALKTGALIEWSCAAGAILGGADPTSMVAYARALGLAFQIVDDILDVEGDSDLAGKRLRKDAAAGKATFVSLLGLEGARSRAESLVAEAEDALSGHGAAADGLRQAARFVISRRM